MPEARPPFLPAYLPYLLQRADQLLSARFHRTLQRRGVQTSEWRVLAALRDHGPVTVGALSRLVSLPQPTTTHAVARLERDGAVERRPGSADGRHRIVALTPAGRRTATELTRLAARELARTLAEAAAEVPPELVVALAALVAELEDTSIQTN